MGAMGSVTVVEALPFFQFRFKINVPLIAEKLVKLLPVGSV